MVSTWTMGGVGYSYWEPRFRNERDIELPFARAVLKWARLPILEVGNATQRYLSGPPRDVVCRYDTMGGVYPVYLADIVGWHAAPDIHRRYRTILSISTLEHVGWEEPEERDPGKAIGAIEHLLDMLAPAGELAFTVPTGYHPDLASWVARQAWTDVHLMERVNEAGDWEERPIAEFEPQEFPGHPWGWSARKVLMVRHIA